MRDDQRFEIERAFDLLPHVVGASWATIWFRINSQKNPTVEEFRSKTAQYFEMLDSIYTAYENDEKFEEISRYVKARKDEELKKILSGENKEIEKRYKRYVDYG